MQTACEHNRTHALGQYPPVISAESHKVLPFINLKMRKLPSIKSLPHKVFDVCGGQPPSAVREAKLGDLEFRVTGARKQ